MHAHAASLCSINVNLGPKEQRILITGLHTVADIHCTTCNAVVGWKYVSVGSALFRCCAW